MRIAARLSNPGLLAVMLMATSGISSAEQTATRTYGVQDATVHTIHAYAFKAGFLLDNPSRIRTTAQGGRWCEPSVFDCLLNAAVFLPAGAVVTGIEIDGCDGMDNGELSATLWRKPLQFGPAQDSVVAIVSAGTGFTDAPGCATVSAAPTAPETIDNRNNSYFVQLLLGDSAGAEIRLHAVRIFYHLQVGPAPATARFDDVPTSHVFFQFIEALAAAGITTGCSLNPPLYCPDDPVTRGQMAMLISRALGLHFPN